MMLCGILGGAGPSPTPPAMAATTDAPPSADVSAGAVSANAHLTRGGWATLVVTRLGLPTRHVYSFPVFRDVPSTHPDFRGIGVLWQRGWMQPTDTHRGLFEPDRPIELGLLWDTLALIATPRDLSMLDKMAPCTGGDGGTTQFTGEPLTRDLRWRALERVSCQTLPRERAQELVSPADASTWFSKTIRLQANAPVLRRQDINQPPPLPSGLEMLVTPATLYSWKESLTGMSLTFNLSRALEFPTALPVQKTNSNRMEWIRRAPEGSVINAHIIAHNATTPEVTVECTSLVIPGRPVPIRLKAVFLMKFRTVGDIMKQSRAARAKGTVTDTQLFELAKKLNGPLKADSWVIPGETFLTITQPVETPAPSEPTPLPPPPPDPPGTVPSATPPEDDPATAPAPQPPSAPVPSSPVPSR